MLPVFHWNCPRLSRLFCTLSAKQEAANICSLTSVQAERWGSELLTEDVEHVDLSKRPFTVRTSDTEVQILLLPDVLLFVCLLHCMLMCRNSITYSCCYACQVKTHSIIIATGATAKKLGIPSEEKFWSQGISACAICDGMRMLPFVSLPLQHLNLSYRALTTWTTTLNTAVPVDAPAAGLTWVHAASHIASQPVTTEY